MSRGRIFSESEARRATGFWRQRCGLVYRIAALVVLSSLNQPIADAQPGTTLVQSNGSAFKMPINRATSRQSGLTLQVDTRWVSNYGYRPVEFVFSSSSSTTADQSIKIRLHGGWFSNQFGTMSVERTVDLPAGSTTQEVIVSYPQYRRAIQFFWWDVLVDGIKDEELSLEYADAIQWTPGMSQPVSDGLVMLAVGPKSQHRQLTASPLFQIQVLSLPTEEFPTRWSSYASFDLVALSVAELDDLVLNNPRGIAALRQWVNAGGQLWIGGVGDQWEVIPEVSEALSLRGEMPATHSESVRGDDDTEQVDPSSDEAVYDDEKPVLAQGWHARQFRRGRRTGADSQFPTFVNLLTSEVRTPSDADEVARLLRDPNFVVRPVSEERSSSETRTLDELTTPDVGNGGLGGRDRGRRRNWPEDSSKWFVEHELGMGYVRAFRGPWDPVAIDTFLAPSDDPVVVDPIDRMPAPMRAAFTTATNWKERHGLAPDEANPDFAHLLVPGLGLAPVTEFRILITVFVLLIGPINYWILKRFRRLYLLVLTVPLAAGVLTIALFAYATISDGFGTAVRVRSYTTLDQRSGDATCWSRLSYYSGLAPAAGLTFPDDLVVYPIVPGWSDSRFDPDLGTPREVAWTPAGGRLTHGWLASRTPTQFLTVRSRKSSNQVGFDQAGDRLRATNELGATIRYLAVVDGKGNVYSGEDLAAEDRVFLKSSTRSEAIRNIRLMIISNHPEAPPALSGDVDIMLLGRPRAYRRQSRSYGEVRLEESLLEHSIGELGGMHGRPPLQLGPNSYVAITESGPEVSLGIDEVEEQASFHVLVGRW